MKNTLTIDLNTYEMTTRLAYCILAGARKDAEMHRDGPTLGKDVMAPTIQYRPSADSYIFIEGFDTTEMSHDAAIDYLVNYRSN